MHDSTQLHHHAHTTATAIANELTDVKPWQPVDPNMLATITRHAVDMYGNGLYADMVTDACTELMPLPRPGETRGEYALRIRAIVGRTHA